MTDKEKIIIDGVDVSECAIYRSSHTRTLCCSGIYCKEQQFYNCYFKQLVRKTQECEELKEQLQANQPTGICETCMANAILQNDKYRKALEEIEKVINNILNSCLGRNTAGCRPAHNVCGDLINILDIINNARKDNHVK